MFGLATFGFVAQRPWATGGTITNIPGYRVHRFSTVGTSSVQIYGNSSMPEFEYLVVAGGGGSGGGDNNTRGGGGGGAGGMRTGSIALSPGPYTAVVGDGGLAGIPVVGDQDPTQGDPSSIFGISCTGGGYGGEGYAGLLNGGPGGSGGGGARIRAGGEGIEGEGNSGGTSPGLDTSSNDGGGGGGKGSAGLGRSPGAGQASSITGTSITYAAGGIGGLRDAANNGTPGSPNTGNGATGGGGSLPPNGSQGARGGSGVIVFRYRV